MITWLVSALAVQGFLQDWSSLGECRKHCFHKEKWEQNPDYWERLKRNYMFNLLFVQCRLIIIRYEMFLLKFIVLIVMLDYCGSHKVFNFQNARELFDVRKSFFWRPEKWQKVVIQLVAAQLCAPQEYPKKSLKIVFTSSMLESVCMIPLGKREQSKASYAFLFALEHMSKISGCAYPVSFRQHSQLQGSQIRYYQF